jgi:DUF971 family protein
MLQPLRIQLDKAARQLVIEWPDRIRNRYPWHFLRAHCPSAGERVARESSDPLAILGAIPSSDIVDARMVGNYAIAFTWGDGHNAGIYTWEYLRELADDPAVEGTAYA